MQKIFIELKLEANVNRRKYLAGVVAGASTLAGCSSQSENSGKSNVNVAWPKVTDSQIDSWKQVDKRKKKHASQGGVTPHERTYIYQNAALRKEVKTKTLGEFDSTLATFFASHIDLRGWTTSFANEKKIGKNLVPQFRKQLKNNGVKDVREISPNSPKPNPESGTKVYEFRGNYPTPPIEKEVNILDSKKRKVKFEADKIPVTGLVAVWKTESGHAFAAGGAFPAGSYDKTDTISVTSEEGDGIDVTVSIDLGLRPHQLRQEIIELSENVTMESQ